jgi:hypothetical protein
MRKIISIKSSLKPICMSSRIRKQKRKYVNAKKSERNITKDNKSNKGSVRISQYNNLIMKYF